MYHRSMVFYGIDLATLQAIAAKLELVIDNPRQLTKNAIAVKLTPINSDHRYARKTARGRRVKACSYEAFRDFVLSAFENGAYKVNTIHPRARKHASMNRMQFESMLGWDGPFYNYNVGSPMYPVTMGELSNETVQRTVVKVLQQ